MPVNETPGYYDVPMLKPPVWTWEIETYFFTGGLSAGAYILSRLAERLADDRPDYHRLSRTGGIISAVAALPCAPLLIADLGDRERFHHMLRVFKPSSPMNLGSWVLAAYSPLALLMGLRAWAQVDPDRELPLIKAALRAADPALTFVADIAGIPLALLLAGYTGVLLSGTATPVWSKNPYLGALFSAGAMSAGASALGLADALSASNTETEGSATKALTHIGTVSHAAEAATLTGYLREAGEFAEPITRGPLAAALWGGVVAAGIALPELLELIPAPPRAKRWLRIAGSVSGLVGGFLLRRVIVRAGTLSANDPKATRRATQSRPTSDPHEEHGPGVTNNQA